MRSAREAVGLTVAELAGACNISLLSIEHFEAGHAKPDWIEADYLAAALGVPFDILVE